MLFEFVLEVMVMCLQPKHDSNRAGRDGGSDSAKLRHNGVPAVK